METILTSWEDTLTRLNAREFAAFSCGESARSVPTCHELSERFRTRGRDGQGQLVDGNAVGDGESVDPFVRRLASKQLPEQDAVAGGGKMRIDFKAAFICFKSTNIPVERVNGWIYN